jgi:nucleotide-binding universal stress UspA family protein
MRSAVVAGVSDQGAGAVLEVAAALATVLGDGLVVVHVEGSALVDANLATGAGSGALVAANTELSDRCHLDCELALAGRPVAWRFEVRAGEPSAELIRVARHAGAAFLVVGRGERRRSGPRRRKPATLERLLADSPVPVVAVPPPA